ncbi:hypothetical protein V6N12_051117 [Hibiscus sabdariffa]|uniref:BED-type domain-containing protein n=1 Tax=Hibiscus sabdariffa TaxID=183260 RepID=A0ABR2GG84_9ROSI
MAEAMRCIRGERLRTQPLEPPHESRLRYASSALHPNCSKSSTQPASPASPNTAADKPTPSPVWLFIMDMGSNATGSSVSSDPTRKYGKPDASNRNNYLCDFCGKITKGGAYKMKQHLVGGFTSVRKCPQCPERVREEVKAFMLKKEKTKITNLMSSQEFSYDVDDHDEEEELEVLNSGKDVASSSATFTLRSCHQALSHHDDEVEKDIGEDEDYRLDGDDFCEDGGDLE